jgi:hypothetical protein
MPGIPRQGVLADQPMPSLKLGPAALYPMG